jgi:hypothetical protein
MNYYLGKIRTVLNSAKKQKYMDEVPEIPFYKIVDEKLPGYLQPEEIDKILKVAKEKIPEF